MLIENIRLALSSIKANKKRSFLTMLGIIIGIGSVIAIMTVGNSLTASTTSSMESLGLNNIEVYIYEEYTGEGDGFTGSYPTFSEEVLRGLVDSYSDKIDGISVTESVGDATIRSASSKLKASLIGVSAGYFKANSYTLLAGNFLSKSNYENANKTIMISDKVAESVFGSNDAAIGEQIELEVNNSYSEYTVVGVYEYKEDTSYGVSSGQIVTSAFIPLKTAQNQTHNQDISGFTVVAFSGTDTTQLAEDVKTYLNAHMDIPDELQLDAYSMQSMVEETQTVLKQITLAISLIAGIALLVGGIGVMNIMTVSVTERTREIGTRKALGAENGHIMMQFITEAVILCLVGGLIGVAFGVAIGIIASHIMGYPTTVSVISILVSVGFSMAVGLFFGYYPARNAAKMNPIDALRYE